MADNSGDQSDLFAGAIPASHLALPGSDRARKMTATSGRNFSELLESVSPIGYLRKMLLDTSTWASTKCLLTWKVKATPLNRLLFQLAPSMPRTEGIESGLWPTPDQRGFTNDGSVEALRKKASSREEWRAMSHRVGKKKHDRLWPTPMKADDPRNGLWATPNTMDSLPPRSEEAMQKHMDHPKRRGQIKPENLRDQVKMLPTPRTQMTRTTKEDRGKSNLEELVGQGENGTLNPNWVEWLMGYPTGWTDLDS